MSSIEQSFASADEFNEAINAAVAAAGVEEPAAAEIAEKRSEETPPAPETEEELEQPEAEPEAAAEGERLYAGKYKTVEAMEEAVAHQEEMIRRQAEEVGESRKLRESVEQMRAELEGLRAPGEPVLDERAVTVTGQLVEQGRYQEAADYALRANPYLYRSVMEEWVQAEPFQAMDFHSAQREQLLQERFQKQVAPGLEAAGEIAQRGELTQALDVVARAHEDFGEVVGSLDEERLSAIVAGGFPVQVLQGLQGGQAEKQAVFETLYRWVKADQAGALGDAAARAVEQKRVEQRSQKAQAAVASQTTSPNLEQPEQTPEQAIADAISAEWDIFAKERSVLEGWTGRDSRGSPR